MEQIITRLVGLQESYNNNRSFITNEETTKNALVIPFISMLGYNIFNPREVRPEFTADFTLNDGKKYPDRMDYAIINETNGNADVVIEVKPLGTAAVSFAEEHDESENGETAEEYLEEKLREAIGEPSEDGLYSVFFVSTDEEYQLDENYDTREQAIAAAKWADKELNKHHPGGNLLCYYEPRFFNDGKWESALYNWEV